MPPIKVEIMTSETCPFCPPAKEVVKKVCKKFGKRVKLVETSIDTKEGAARAEALGITMVPTILIENEPKFTGPPREEHLEAVINHFLSEK
ncbi:MAG: thioredoxin family protein [Candidatus Aenigmatarchaeota archaeon]|nr:thioredoxin family protein [Candidatus Aenigmarchaeota archaeon]